MDQRIVKDCYVFGSPPVVSEGSVKELGGAPGGDAVLEVRSACLGGIYVLHQYFRTYGALLTQLSPSQLFGYSTDMIKSFVQPWDPVTRLFTSSDPTYPLVGDLGPDGVTLYASGPNRILRPLVRSILLIGENIIWAKERCDELRMGPRSARGLAPRLTPPSSSQRPRGRPFVTSTFRRAMSSCKTWVGKLSCSHRR